MEFGYQQPQPPPRALHPSSQPIKCAHASRAHASRRRLLNRRTPAGGGCSTANRGMRRHTRTHTCIRPQRARAAIRSLLATRRAVPDARARTRARARGPAAAAAQTQARRACGPVRPPAFESGRLLLCGKSLDALTARTRQRNQRASASASAINLACRRPLWPPPASQYPSVAPNLCLDPAALHPPPSLTCVCACTTNTPYSRRCATPLPGCATLPCAEATSCLAPCQPPALLQINL